MSEQIIDRLVAVTPNEGGDTLTAYNSHDRQQNLGKLLRGAEYRAAVEYGGMYRLVKEKMAFPLPGYTGEVWADKRFLPFVPDEPVVPDEPEFVGSIWMVLVLEIGKAIVKVLG